MAKTSNAVCPDCNEPTKHHRIRMRECKKKGSKNEGLIQYAGEYYSCRCYRLTYSPETGTYNDRGPRKET